MTKQSQITKSLITIVGNCLLILIAVYCTFGVLITAFGFPVEIRGLFGIWLLNSLVIAAIAIRYRGRGILALTPVAVALLVWKYPEIAEGAKWVIFSITDYYNNWLSVTVLFPGSRELKGDPAVFFAAAGIAVTFLLAIAICLRRSTFFTVLSTLPIVLLTFVITDTQADVLYLFGLVAVYLTMLFSSALSPDDFQKRGLIHIPMLALAMLFVGLTYIAVPPEKYKRDEQISALNSQARLVATQIGRFVKIVPGGANLGVGWPEGASYGAWMFDVRKVSVADAGMRIITDKSLLEVIATEPGTFYLRGYSLQHFEGRSWYRNTETIRLYDDETARSIPAMIAHMYGSGDTGEAPRLTGIVINRTGDASDVDYVPYYSGYSLFNIAPSGGDFYRDMWFYYTQGNIHKLAGSMSPVYFLDGEEWIDDSDITIIPNAELDNYTEQIMSTGIFTEIDESTAQGLRQLAFEAGIDPTADRVAVVDAVAAYIRSSAGYTLTPGTIPRDEDFALYFLETLKEGYCVHFATAAVLMLRALDIPARFTSGFVVTVPQSEVGNAVVATDRNAHAWVEVYYEDAGWLYLEVTPPAAGSITPAARPHDPEASTSATPAPMPARGPNEGDRTPEDIQPGNNSPLPGTGAGEQKLRLLPAWMYTTVIIIICIGICAAILPVRRHIVRKLRAKSFEQADTNKAVISIWKYIIQLSSREAIPLTEVEELALKARFSQYRITEEEYTKMVMYANKLTDEIYTGKDSYGRFWLKYIRALY